MWPSNNNNNIVLNINNNNNNNNNLRGDEPSSVTLRGRANPLLLPLRGGRGGPLDGAPGGAEQDPAVKV